MNIVVNLHRQMRKVTKNRSVFPTHDSLFKLLYLAVKDVTMKWMTPKWNWGQVIAQLTIHFEGRVELDVIRGHLGLGLGPCDWAPSKRQLMGLPCKSREGQVLFDSFREISRF